MLKVHILIAQNNKTIYHGYHWNLEILPQRGDYIHIQLQTVNITAKVERVIHYYKASLSTATQYGIIASPLTYKKQNGH